MKSIDIAAVAMFTDTGTTARFISKNRPPCPLLALASDIETVRRCCLYYGVVPRLVEAPQHTSQLLELAKGHCRDLGLAQPGERIIVVAGHPIGVRDQTNGLIIEMVD
jgi:pyruvate kinase